MSIFGCTEVTIETPSEPLPIPTEPVPCDSSSDTSVTLACWSCVGQGCPDMPNEYICEESWLRHSDMMLCVNFPGPQEKCPDCKGLKNGDAISYECIECAKQYSPCNFDCSKTQF